MASLSILDDMFCFPIFPFDIENDGLQSLCHVRLMFLKGVVD
jgi:hypothetical protein